MRLRTPARIACLTLLVTSLSPAFAHHTYAMFDAGRKVTLHGTVKEFQWTNPHSFLQVLVPDGSTVTEWSVQMDSPNPLYRKGWRPGSLKPGDKVSVIIHPSRDGSHSGSFTSVIGPDGKEMFPDRPPASSQPAAAALPEKLQ